MSGLPGWRATVGFVSPAPERHSPGHEFDKFAPKGVTWCETRIPARNVNGRVDMYGTPTTLKQCVDIMNLAGCDVIILKGTPIVLRYGEKIRRKLRSGSKVPIVFLADALVEGVKKVGAEKIALAQPFANKETQEKHVKLFEDAGIEVSEIGNIGAGFNIASQAHLIPPSHIYKFSKRLFLHSENAQALVLSGGAIPYTDIVGALENDIGAPVIASLPAACWKALDLLQIREEIKGFGRLLGSLSEK